jgi:hypothetical protein
MIALCSKEARTEQQQWDVYLLLENAVSVHLTSMLTESFAMIADHNNERLIPKTLLTEVFKQLADRGVAGVQSI